MKYLKKKLVNDIIYIILIINFFIMSETPKFEPESSVEQNQTMTKQEFLDSAQKMLDAWLITQEEFQNINERLESIKQETQEELWELRGEISNPLWENWDISDLLDDYVDENENLVNWLENQLKKMFWDKYSYLIWVSPEWADNFNESVNEWNLVNAKTLLDNFNLGWINTKEWLANYVLALKWAGQKILMTPFYNKNGEVNIAVRLWNENWSIVNWQEVYYISANDNNLAYFKNWADKINNPVDKSKKNPYRVASRNYSSQSSSNSSSYWFWGSVF